MATSTFCCLNNTVPPPTSTSISSQASRKITEVSCPPRDRSRKINRCLLGLTCVIVGLESGNFAVVFDHHQERAIAVDMIMMQSGPLKVTINGPRWSDKRACQPWRLNSLETIVPENLPRPSARRRWEATGFSQAAPPVKVVAKSVAKGCFNL